MMLLILEKCTLFEFDSVTKPFIFEQKSITTLFLAPIVEGQFLVT